MNHNTENQVSKQAYIVHTLAANGQLCNQRCNDGRNVKLASVTCTIAILERTVDLVLLISHEHNLFEQIC